MASSTYSGDYSRDARKTDGRPSAMDKASETAGRIAGTAESVARLAGDKASAVMGSAAETAGRVAGAVEDAAGGLADRTREAREGISEVSGNIYGAVQKSVKKQPMTTLLVAGAVGFVLGAIWKS
jgi:ElaB/YqjD/DUF883 family membrane-anchored ribosome-binding protein